VTETETDVGPLARRKQDRHFAGVAFFLAFFGPLLGLFVLLSRDDRSLGDVPVGAWAQFCLTAFFPVALAVALMWARQRGVSWLQPVLVTGVGRDRRRRIRKAVRTNQRVHPSDQVIAADLARRMVQRRWIFSVLTQVAVFIGVLVLLGVGPWAALLGVLSVLSLLIFAAPFVTLNVQRARRWLEEHQDD
jgi:hypothetical protein